MNAPKADDDLKEKVTKLMVIPTTYFLRKWWLIQRGVSRCVFSCGCRKVEGYTGSLIFLTIKSIEIILNVADRFEAKNPAIGFKNNSFTCVATTCNLQLTCMILEHKHLGEFH